MQVIEYIQNTFSNREISIIFWLILLLLWSFRSQNVRFSFAAVIRSFFKVKILSSILAMIVYVSIIIYFLQKAKIWNISVLKDTIWWFIGAGFVALVETVRKRDKKAFFKKLLRDNIKLIVIIEFIVALHSFNLFAELVFVPFVGLMGMMMGYAQVKDEYSAVARLMENLLALAGVSLIIYAGYLIVVNYSSFDAIENLRQFILPILLTANIIPFLYFTSLVAEYEQIFIRINLFGNHSDNKSEIKKNIILLCNFNLWRLLSIKEGAEILHVETKEDLIRLIRERKN